MRTVTSDVIVRYTLVAGDLLLTNRYEGVVANFRGSQQFELDEARHCTPRAEQQKDLIEDHHRGGALAEARSRRQDSCPNMDFDHYYAHNFRLPSGEPFDVLWCRDHP
jgi:hypothetical protein